MNKAQRFNTTNKSKKGFYVIQNPEKYIGDPANIMYMSSYEHRFMVYCDFTEAIVKWGSEYMFIPYVMEKKNPETGVIKKTNHKYFPDFYMEVLTGNEIKKYIVEIKPSNETVPPVAPKSFTTKSMRNFEYSITAYEKNMYKWSKAKEYCDARGLIFKLITEKDLNIK